MCGWQARPHRTHFLEVAHAASLDVLPRTVEKLVKLPFTHIPLDLLVETMLKELVIPPLEFSQFHPVKLLNSLTDLVDLAYGVLRFECMMLANERLAEQ